MYNRMISLTTARLAFVLTVTASVSLQEPLMKSILVTENDNNDSHSNDNANNWMRTNYSHMVDNQDETDGSGTPSIDFSSIQGILQSLKLLTARRDIRHVIPRPQGVNERCYDDSINFLDTLIGFPTSNRSQTTESHMWALRMFDAFGKPGSALFEGSFQWVGSYDECRNVHAFIPEGTRFGSRVLQRASEFDTQYCRAEIVLGSEFWKYSTYASQMNEFWKSKESPDLIVNWGMCLPHSCNGSDVQRLLTESILSRLKLTVQEVVCYEEDSRIHEDAGAIFVMVFLSLFFALVITCTVVETFWHYTRANENKTQTFRDDGGQALKDGTDLTLIVTATKSVDKDKVILNGSSSPCKNNEYTPVPTHNGKVSLGNGNAGKPNCNGVGIHGKENGHLYNQVPSGYDGKQIDKDSHNYQINNGCDETRIVDTSILDVEKELPVSHDGKSPREKDEIKACLQEKKKPRREGIGRRIVQAFSMRMNLIRLLKTSGASRPGVIRCLDGIRVVSMLWIMLGHTYTFGAMIDSGNIMFSNSVETAKTTASVAFCLVTGGTFAVDSFFVMSGMLVTMLTLKDLKKNKPSLGYWSLFYVHRIWRLTPVYMVVLMFCITMYDHTVGGPLKSMPLNEYEDCNSKWWSHLLYISNLYEPQQKCMTWTWYLAVDMQLYCISPIVIYVLHRSKRVGQCCILMLLAAGMMSAFLCQYYYFGQFMLMDLVFKNYWEHVYIVPWTRIGAFAVGMFTGVCLYHGDQKPTISKIMAVCIWVLITCVAILIIFIPNQQWKEGSKLWAQSWQALYEALSRPTWAVCVATAIYMCQTGRGGIANNILSWPGFQPFSRITFAVYLVHPVVMTFFVYSRHDSIFLQSITIIYQYIGNVVLSYIFGTILCIMFESPITTLEKILLNNR